MTLAIEFLTGRQFGTYAQNQIVSTKFEVRR